MILAALTLIGIGAADLVRQFVPARGARAVLLAAIAVLVLALGALSEAIVPAVAAVIAGALWLWTMPRSESGKASFWPAAALAGLCAGATALIPARPDAGLIGQVWRMPTPGGELPFDTAMLALGALLFVLESANLIVRAALDGEGTWRPADQTGPFKGGRLRQPQPAAGGFRGGRLIGPLERVLVLVLTLASAYALLAAMLAAKGIVRFPEISRDGETGARAEYFLVGSLVSWVSSLAAAFLVWWALHT